MLQSIWSYIAGWFGYISWCMSATDMACRPFLAFVALLAASGGTLVLLCVAMSTLLNDIARDLEQRRRQRGIALQTAAVQEGIRARPAASHTPSEVRIEPQLVPGAMAFSMAEPALREVAVAAAPLNPPSPPVL